MERELLAPAKVELAVEALTWAAMSKATSQDISKFDYIYIYICIIIYINIHVSMVRFSVVYMVCLS